MRQLSEQEIQCRQDTRARRHEERAALWAAMPGTCAVFTAYIDDDLDAVIRFEFKHGQPYFNCRTPDGKVFLIDIGENLPGILELIDALARRYNAEVRRLNAMVQEVEKPTEMLTPALL